jgi:hypothetical protein
MTVLRPALDSAIRVPTDGKHEKFSSALLASRWRMNLAVEESISIPVAQSRAFQLIVTELSAESLRRCQRVASIS